MSLFHKAVSRIEMEPFVQLLSLFEQDRQGSDDTGMEGTNVELDIDTLQCGELVESQPHFRRST